MRYHVLHIKTTFAEEWQRDLFDLHICELGVDTIDAGDSPETATQADYYIPTGFWETNHEDIEAFIGFTEGAELLSVEPCEDQNWNAAWEAEHPVQELPLGVRITPHCAFGAGHHETTGMMIDALLARDLKGKTVLDNGCGTGVLGIMAAKQGAREVVAVDIDDKAVINTRENAEANDVRLDVRQREEPPCGSYDLILSNIHRNVLMGQMGYYAEYLNPGGELWLSGFLEEDCQPLRECAEAYGLKYLATQHRGEWQMMQFRA
ncbi:MAG: 50S ribosomal protein L11 methyltransferase [Paludibacteraceae bacterium]|nr:50S ribosomal protein L11 methyltransferase [Paludibacteraceae bacterium]